MSRRKTKKGATKKAPDMMLPYESAHYTPNRSLIFAPASDPRRAISGGELRVIQGKARALETNSAEVRMIVRDMCLLSGYLMPRLRTQDPDWNKEARAAFLARVKEASLFDASGTLGWRQSQLWMEHSAVVDGDCLIVALRHPDGGAMFAFYEGGQLSLTSDGVDVVNGVRVDSYGRPRAYAVRTNPDDPADVTWISARHARLFRHRPRVGQPRGVSELQGAINGAQDLYELYGYHKAAAKLAASFAIVETKSLDDMAPDASGFDSARNGAEIKPEAPITVNGVKAVSLAPGRRMEFVADRRPSPEQRQLREDLTDQLAYSCGLDPVAVYHPEKMGSAAARYTLQKLNDTIRDRHLDLVPVLNWMLAHVLDCEIAAGRLRPCGDFASRRCVEWIPRTNWTIDRGREGALAINLVQSGLADANEWTEATSEKTVVEIAEQRAHDIAVCREIAARYGLALSDIIPGPVGSTAPAIGTGTPILPPEDPSPEGESA